MQKYTHIYIYIYIHTNNNYHVANEGMDSYR